MVAAAILNVSHCTFFDMTDAFYIGVAPISLNLARMSWIVKNWRQFFGIQDAALLILGNYAFCRLNCIVHRGCCMFTKFGENRSNSDELTTVFRNSRWRQPPYWIMIIVLSFDLADAFYIRFATFPPNLVRIGQIVKKWQQFFEIQDGDDSHLEKNTSGLTASMRKDFLVRNFQLKI